MLALMESLDTLAEAVGDPESTLDALSVNGTVGDLYIWTVSYTHLTLPTKA